MRNHSLGGKGRWPSGRVEPMSRDPEGRGLIPRLGNRRSSPSASSTLNYCVYTPSLVLCCAWLVTMAFNVHCGLGQLNPLPSSWGGDDKQVAAITADGQSGGRISDTHRLRSSLQFRYSLNIKITSLYFYYMQNNIFGRLELFSGLIYFVSIRRHYLSSFNCL